MLTFKEKRKMETDRMCDAKKALIRRLGIFTDGEINMTSRRLDGVINAFKECYDATNIAENRLGYMKEASGRIQALIQISQSEDFCMGVMAFFDDSLFIY